MGWWLLAPFAVFWLVYAGVRLHVFIQQYGEQDHSHLRRPTAEPPLTDDCISGWWREEKR